MKSTLISNLFGFTLSSMYKSSLHIPQGAVDLKQQRESSTVALTIFSEFFPPDYAPTGQLLDELTQALADQNLNVHVFSNQPGYAYDQNSRVSPRREQRGKVRVRRSGAAQFWPSRIRGKAVAGFIFFIRSIIQFLRVPRSNSLILLTTAPPFLPLLGIFAHFLKIPFVCLIYDLYPDIAIELGVISKSHILCRIWRYLNRSTWLKASKIIVLSPAMRQSLINHCPQIADKISVIHSWANSSIIPIAKQDNHFAIENSLDQKFTVLYSGNMGRCHDMDTILGAANYLKNDPIQFVFIGGGAQYDVFIKKAEKLCLMNCKFLPYQPKSMLPYSLTACDVSLVSVSSGMEAFVAPSKFYSALASGRPVAAVCPKSSFLSNLITEANCGTTFENGDSRGLAKFIRLLCKDPQLSSRMGLRGRKYLDENFTLPHIASNYSRVFHDAIHDLG